MTAATVVCWSIASETQIAYGSCVRRHGRSRLCLRYQRRSGARSALGSARIARQERRGGGEIGAGVDRERDAHALRDSGGQVRGGRETAADDEGVGERAGVAEERSDASEAAGQVLDRAADDLFRREVSRLYLEARADLP